MLIATVLGLVLVVLSRVQGFKDVETPLVTRSILALLTCAHFVSILYFVSVALERKGEVGGRDD